MTCGIVSEVFYLTELGTDAWKNCPLLDGNSPSGAREELVLSLGKEHEDEKKESGLQNPSSFQTTLCFQKLHKEEAQVEVTKSSWSLLSKEGGAGSGWTGPAPCRQGSPASCHVRNTSGCNQRFQEDASYMAPFGLPSFPWLQQVTLQLFKIGPARDFRGFSSAPVGLP